MGLPKSQLGPWSRYGEQVDILHPDDFMLRWAKHMIKYLYFPECPTCAGKKHEMGLTKKCRDWHEICHCGEPYDQPKGAGCRRRKHPKVEK